nr:MAG: hypothetical protein [Microvirus sp.]
MTFQTKSLEPLDYSQKKPKTKRTPWRSQMRYRKKQSKFKSRRQFKKGTGLHPLNSGALAMRGGVRL